MTHDHKNIRSEEVVRLAYVGEISCTNFIEIVLVDNLRFSNDV